MGQLPDTVQVSLSPGILGRRTEHEGLLGKFNVLRKINSMLYLPPLSRCCAPTRTHNGIAFPIDTLRKTAKIAIFVQISENSRAFGFFVALEHSGRL
jgi:hypothetical protein